MYRIIVLILLSITILSGYEVIDTQKSKEGTTFILRLKAGPWQYNSGMNKTAVFVPSHYRNTGNWDALVHFHGHSCSMEYALKGYELREQLSESKQNVILIIPNLSSDSNSGNLMKKGGFRLFLNEIGSFLQSKHVARATNPRMIVISSHSGGFKPMAMAIKNGGVRIREVILFDSLYAEEETFVSWLTENKLRRFLDLIGPSTKACSQKMMKMLSERKIPYKSAKEGDLSRKELVRSRIVFLETKQGHNECLKGHCNYRDYLFRSCLKRYVKTDWFEK